MFIMFEYFVFVMESLRMKKGEDIIISPFLDMSVGS